MSDKKRRHPSQVQHNFFKFIFTVCQHARDGDARDGDNSESIKMRYTVCMRRGKREHY